MRKMPLAFRGWENANVAETSELAVRLAAGQLHLWLRADPKIIPAESLTAMPGKTTVGGVRRECPPFGSLGFELPNVLIVSR